MVADTAPFFAPLEKEIQTSFLPSLLGIPLTESDGAYRQLLTHSIKLGGLAICNPVNSAPRIHLASFAATRHLLVSLMDARTRFDLTAHFICATDFGQVARKDQLHNE